MPWSDWEVPGDQIEICRRPDGLDWELGAGAFGKVWLHAWHSASHNQPAKAQVHSQRGPLPRAFFTACMPGRVNIAVP